MQRVHALSTEYDSLGHACFWPLRPDLLSIHFHLAASHLSVCPTLVHLEDLPDKRKMSYGRINRQKQIENEQKKISFYPVGDPRVPKRVLGGWLKKC